MAILYPTLSNMIIKNGEPHDCSKDGVLPLEVRLRDSSTVVVRIYEFIPSI